MPTDATERPPQLIPTWRPRTTFSGIAHTDSTQPLPINSG